MDVVRNMIVGFPNIKHFLSVGIGGGVPSKKHDIRLGDVVVGVPRSTQGTHNPGWCRVKPAIGSAPPPMFSQALVALFPAVFDLMSQYEIRGNHLGADISDVLKRTPALKRKLSLPDSSTDRLYDSGTIHPYRAEIKSCEDYCKNRGLVTRPDRPMSEKGPAKHYGLIHQ